MERSLLIAITFLFFLMDEADAQNMCPGFGVNGIAASLESHSTHLNALTVLPNGKIVAVGYYDNSGEKDFLVARYHANGTPDLTFSSNGLRTYDVGDHADDEALCVAVATDGNVLVGGVSAGYGIIIKLNSSGSLMSSFGVSGKAKYDVLYSSVEDIMISSQGTIYGVGKSFHTENIVFRRLKIQAYNSNGTLLTSFSDDGKYDRTDFLLWHTTVVKGALQADGKLVIGGTTPSSSNLLDNWFLVRLNTNGTPDNTFHADGLVEDPESVTSRLRDLSIGADGSIYVGGFNNQDSDFPTLAIAKKFKPNGDSDNSFNMTGSAAHLGAGNTAMLHALAVDGTGRIYFTGSKGTSDDNHDFLFGAFKANGEHDADFTLTDKIAGTTHGEMLDIVRLSDGSFITCGYALGKDHRYGILRKYKADGTIESNFNSSGSNFIRHAKDGETRTVAVQHDGKILAGGVYLENGSNTGIALARFLPDGSPDLSFGTYGYARLDLSDRREFLYDLYVYPNGKILAAGTMNDAVSHDDFLIVRFNSDGSIDESFGTDGYIRKHVGAYGKHNNLNAITVDAQGRILIAGDGNYNGGSYQNATLMRLLPDGSTDLNFADDGVFNINLTVVNDYFQDVVVAENGMIYAAGHGTINMGGAVIKLNDAGELVTDFGTDGVFYTDWEEGYISRAFEIEIAQDGKLLVGCSHEPEDGTPINNSFIYRLLPSGQPDNTFGDNGVIEFHFSSQRDLYGLEVDNTGIIYLSASADNDFYLAKINQEGDVLGDPISVNDLTSRSGIAINKTTGNVYTGFLESGMGGLWVVCVGSGGGGEEPNCADVGYPTISVVGDVLYASEADSYQWYSSGEPLEGETNESLTINPVVGGVFSVTVTIGECTLSSDDLEYVVTGGATKESFQIHVYPNPIRDRILIESESDLSNASISLHSSAGQLVRHRQGISDRLATVPLENLPAGLYILSIQSRDQIQRIKIFKQN